MERLFELLPVIFIIFFVIKKILEGFKELNIDIPQSTVQHSEADISEDNSEDNSLSEKRIQDKIQQNTRDYNKYSESFSENDNTFTKNKNKKSEKNNNKNTKNEKRKRKKSKIKLSSKKTDNKINKEKILGNKIKNKDVVKGFIFKEILDEPRAKRPYRPIYNKKDNN